MFENTERAMNQIIVAIEDDNLKLCNLPRKEQEALFQLIFNCEKLMEYANMKEHGLA
jgi:hypothetical protein